MDILGKAINFFLKSPILDVCQGPLREKCRYSELFCSIFTPNVG